MGKRIESESVTIQRSAGDIYSFISDFNNFSHLVPEQVTNWQASQDQCSFELQGLARLGMRITERVPGSKVVMAGEGKLPFEFTLICQLMEIGSASASARLIMDTDMNTFMSMMAEKPIENFINILVSRLKEVMEGRG